MKGQTMHPAVAVGIAILLIATGLAIAVRPRLVSQFQEDADTTPEQAVREVRIGGILMLVFGAAFLYSIMTA